MKTNINNNISARILINYKYWVNFSHIDLNIEYRTLELALDADDYDVIDCFLHDNLNIIVSIKDKHNNPNFHEIGEFTIPNIGLVDNNTVRILIEFRGIKYLDTNGLDLEDLDNLKIYQLSLL